MNHNKRIFLAALIGVVIFTSPLFLISPVTGLLVAAYVASLAAVGAVTAALYWAVNRERGLFVTTAAIPLLMWSYAVFNLLFSGAVLVLQYTGAWNMPVGWFVLGHIVLACIYGWKLLAVDAGKEEIENTEVRVRESISTWKTLQLKTADIAAQSDVAVKKSVERVRDAVRYGDPVTSPELEAIEQQISSNIELLSIAVKAKDHEKTEALVPELLQLIKQRTEISKTIK